MHRTTGTTDALQSLLLQIRFLRGEHNAPLPNEHDKLEDLLNAAILLRLKKVTVGVGDEVREEYVEDATPDPKLIIVLDGLDEADDIIPPLAIGSLRRGVYLFVAGRAEEDSIPRYLAEWHSAASEQIKLFRRFNLEPLDG